MLNYKEVDYKNYGKCLEVSNGIIDLLITLDIGPRIIRYGFCGKENIMFEDINREHDYQKDDLKEMFGKDAHWFLYGGHRLWISPEYTETYYPDNKPVHFTKKNDGVCLYCDTQEITGLQFRMDIKIEESTSNVKITHSIENKSGDTTEFSLWALTVLDKGGIELIPWNDNDTVLLPNRTVMAWPYTDFSDDRLYMGKKYMSLKQDSEKEPIKLGFDLNKSLAAYINKGFMFVKRFNYYENAIYPDNGCCFETYSNHNFLECETLSEFGPKPDGSTVSHVEYWTLFDGVSIKNPKDEKEIESIFKKYSLD